MLKAAHVTYQLLYLFPVGFTPSSRVHCCRKYTNVGSFTKHHKMMFGFFLPISLGRREITKSLLSLIYRKWIQTIAIVEHCTVCVGVSVHTHMCNCVKLPFKHNFLLTAGVESSSSSACILSRMNHDFFHESVSIIHWLSFPVSKSSFYPPRSYCAYEFLDYSFCVFNC